MQARCYNRRERVYALYGGRGITVCAGWLSGLDAFILVMGDRPDSHSLDRIDVNKGYWCGACPECRSLGRALNCRWATAATQARNKRTNVLTMSLAREIRTRSAGGETARAIARCLGVNHYSVERVVRNEQWREEA